jgi:hypothetical protein
MADFPAVVVPILRSGVLARQFCQRIAFGNVEAVFGRCLYLRFGDDFVCIGEPDIGNGPMTLIADLGALAILKSMAGQVALIRGNQIAIGSSVRLGLDHTEIWRPTGWPICPPPDRLIDICATLAARAATDSPEEGLARCVTGGNGTSERPSPVARVARSRLALFEQWVSGLLETGYAPAAASREAVQGLIGLGPGLTPSGDDLLIGALAMLNAIGERAAHAAMARAIVDVLPGLTTPLSACFLRAAAAGHVGEHLNQIVWSVMTGDVDAAIEAAAKIGHSSGWDMLAGILATLRTAAARRRVRRYPLRVTG